MHGAQMRAVVEIARAQYLVSPGTVLTVDHLDAEPGTQLEFPILLLQDGEQLHVGTPYVAGRARAEVLGHGKGRKVIVFKKKRRKGYKRFKGHRQLYTQLRITAIQLEHSATTAE